MSDIPGGLLGEAPAHVRHPRAHQPAGTSPCSTHRRKAQQRPRRIPAETPLRDLGSLSAFTDVLTRTATFITNARYILAVYTEALLVSVKERSNFDVSSTCRIAVHRKPTLL
ncbi:hypothetical protein [Sorangium sp. So ce124]|uniref:hypothetical protein n=1 Tax=Sorangium sp. So ce124 TaxID=3133280 RepID=UPI003F60F74D